MHLRQYISRVDGTPQNYLLFLPAGAKGPLPLVVVAPFAQKPVRPFLESAHIAWPDDLEDIQNAANTSGVAVALTDGRGNIGDAPIGEADEFEVLNDVNSNYSIDRQRLYLYGTCEGGRRALLLAEHYPGLFAAIGVYGPTLTAYSRYQQGGNDDPFALTGKLSSTPVFLVKGEYDDSPPTADLEAFSAKLKKSGSPSEIEIIPDGMHKQKRVEQRIFPFLVKFKNTQNFVSIEDDYKEAISRAGARE
jgi:pimeloyl-ACP methyl ester carboxylesterase